jgi:signal transduction histidine kinase
VAIRDTLAGESALVKRAAVTVETDIEDAAPPADANETGLKQCLGNLIRNAVQYGGEGRWLGIMVRVVRDGPAAEIQITVKDRGAGMDESELQQVFQPFYRGRAARETLTHGTGLGLSLVKDAIEAMNGRITAQSAPGRGSAFTLHLRVAQDMKS